MEVAIRFERVDKEYILQRHFTYGIKGFMLNFRSALKELKHQRFKALDGISFTVLKGETVGIIGRNGSGKSTILSIIAGTLKPTTGKVFVNGNVSPLLELGAGFHPELTGVENIILNGVLLGMRKKDIMRRLDSIVEFAELGEFIYQPIKTYSSGMLARLGFSVAIHTEPEILLVDEILAVGDVSFQQKCMDKMQEFKRRGVTIVIVSHSEADIKSLCDKVMLLDRGKKVFEGDVEEGFIKFKNLVNKVTVQ